MSAKVPNGIRHLLAIEALLTLAGSMAGSFIVLFLVRDGFGEAEAALFYLIAFVAATAACLAAARTGFRSPRAWMVGALVSLCAFYLSFVFLRGWALLYVAPLFFGPYIVGFWVPFNVLFLGHTSRGNRGELIGIFFLVFPVVSIFAPLLGGALISYVGYWSVFAGAAASLLCGALLIALSPATSSGPMAPRPALRPMGARLGLAFFSEGGQEGVWFSANALLAMTFAHEELYVGMLFALFALAGGVATVYLGKRSDKSGARAMYARVGAAFSVPTILAAAFAPEASMYALAMALANFSLTVTVIFIFAMSTDRMESDHPGSVLARELLLNTGRVVGCAACGVVLLYTNDIRMAFAISAPFIAGAAFVR